jgi:DNA polymerase-3 subunit alpha
MEKFAGYGFNKSHSAAYALLAYQSGYLKAHYPAEFMAATLTSEMADSARIVTLVEECRRMPLEVRPPDVNRSAWKFTIEDGAIRYGLGAVRNVGQAAVEAVVAARTAGGPFQDLFDLARRLDARTFNRRVLESLIASGACDTLGAERGAMFAAAGRVLEQAAALHRERQSGQSSLFGDGGGGGVAVVAPPLPPTEPWSLRDRSGREKEVLGFYFSDHPLEPLREEIAKIATHTIADALSLEDGAEVRVGGLVGEIRGITTRAGKRMAVVTLEDLSGRAECTVFPETYEACRETLVAEELVVVTGRVENQDDRGARLLLSEVRRWEQARSAYRPSLHLEVRAQELSEEWLNGVDEILSAHSGEADVYLYIVMPDRSRQVSRSKRFRVAEGAGVITALQRRFPDLRARWGKGAA